MYTVDFNNVFWDSYVMAYGSRYSMKQFSFRFMYLDFDKLDVEFAYAVLTDRNYTGVKSDAWQTMPLVDFFKKYLSLDVEGCIVKPLYI